MKEKVIGITLKKQDKANIRTVAAIHDVDSSSLIRSVVEDKLQSLNIPISEDTNK